jgi:hypothetical protein
MRGEDSSGSQNASPYHEGILMRLGGEIEMIEEEDYCTREKLAFMSTRKEPRSAGSNSSNEGCT